LAVVALRAAFEAGDLAVAEIGDALSVKAGDEAGE
jgi:hypothetical protein